MYRRSSDLNLDLQKVSQLGMELIAGRYSKTLDLIRQEGGLCSLWEKIHNDSVEGAPPVTSKMAGKRCYTWGL